MRIQTRFNLPGMPRLLFAAGVVLLLSGCMQVRSTAPVEPASREYKLLLDPARFDNSRITGSINELDRFAADAARRNGVAYDGSLRKPVRTREVAFLDVPGKCTLRKNDLVLRLRSKGRKTSATLKYRSGDPALVYRRSPGASSGSAVEVDITPPHETVYSRSLSAKVGNNPLQNLGDLYALFPQLHRLPQAADTGLAIVGNPVYEEVRGKAGLDLGSGGSMSFSLWYRTEGDARPMIAELSFKYATGKNNTADEERARKLFMELQTLEGWLSLFSMTKTAFIYAALPGFCEKP